MFNFKSHLSSSYHQYSKINPNSKILPVFKTWITNGRFKVDFSLGIRMLLRKKAFKPIVFSAFDFDYNPHGHWFSFLLVHHYSDENLIKKLKWNNPTVLLTYLHTGKIRVRLFVEFGKENIIFKLFLHVFNSQYFFSNLNSNFLIYLMWEQVKTSILLPWISKVFLDK